MKLTLKVAKRKIKSQCEMRELHCLKNNFLYNERRFFNKENNMKVAKNTVVSIAYQVRTQDGVLVDASTSKSTIRIFTRPQ